MGQVIISGCNRGIGEGIASILYNAGYNIFGLNRTLAGHDKLYGKEERWKEISCDISNYESVKRAIAAADKPIDVVIANAGIRRFGSVHQLSVEDWHQSASTNLNGVFYLLKETLPYLRASAGHFFIIGSHAAIFPFETSAAYTVSKSGLQNLAEIAFKENREYGVRVTHCSIGSVKNREHKYEADESWKLKPEDIGEVILKLLQLPKNVEVLNIDIRPQNPKYTAKDGIVAAMSSRE